MCGEPKTVTIMKGTTLERYPAEHTFDFALEV